MSAQRLHAAAAKERDEWGDEPSRRLYPQASALHLALADWLEYQGFWHESRDAYNYADTPDAAAARGIADLILGGAR